MAPWAAMAGNMQQSGTAMGGALGSIIGNSAAQGDQDAATNAILQSQAILAQVNIPDPETLKVVLQHLQQQGQLTPELEAAITQQASELGHFTPNQTQQDTRMEALQSLRETGKTGLNSEDRAALNQIRGEVAQQQRAQEQSVEQNAAQRGMGGGGVEMMGKLLAGQQGAQLASQQGDTIAAMAQNRALQAKAQTGQLAGQMTSDDFARAAQIAASNNLINQFNTANARQVQGTNVGLRNAAQVANLAEKQRVADTNVGLANTQEAQNKQVIADDFNRRMQKAQGMSSNLVSAVSPMFNQNAQATRNMWSGIGAAVGGGAGAMAGGAGKASQGGGGLAAGGGGGGFMSVPNGGQSGQEAGTMMAYKGGRVPGNSMFPGDNPENDTVNAKLSPGEVVLPKSVTKKKNAPKEASKFMADILHHMANKHKGS